MTTDECLRFLAQHQPLPPDPELSEGLISEYDDVRRHFIANPDQRCIPLFLNSFGNGSGFGVYQVVDDVFRHYPLDQIVPHLRRALSSPNPGVRYWCTQWAMDFPSPDYVEALGALLRSDLPADQHCHFFALAALEVIHRQYPWASLGPVLKAAQVTVSDPEAMALLDELLRVTGHGAA